MAIIVIRNIIFQFFKSSDHGAVKCYIYPLFHPKNNNNNSIFKFVEELNMAERKRERLTAQKYEI